MSFKKKIKKLKTLLVPCLRYEQDQRSLCTIILLSQALTPRVLTNTLSHTCIHTHIRRTIFLYNMLIRVIGHRDIILADSQLRTHLTDEEQTPSHFFITLQVLIEP